MQPEQEIPKPPADPYAPLLRIAVWLDHYLTDRREDDLSESFLEWLPNSIYHDDADKVFGEVLALAKAANDTTDPTGLHLAMMAELIAANAYTMWSLSGNNTLPVGMLLTTCEARRWVTWHWKSRR